MNINIITLLRCLPLIAICWSLFSPPGMAQPQLLQDSLSGPFVTKSFEKIIEGCEPDSSLSNACSRVSFQYFIPVDSAESLNYIRRPVLKFIRRTHQDATVSKDAEQVASGFFEDFRNAAMGRDRRPAWYLERKVSTVWWADSLLSLRFYEESYTGGAHPNFGAGFQVFDLKRESVVTLDSLIKPDPSDKLLRKAEESFRTEQIVMEGESLDEAGFWFEGKQFYLPENYALTDSGLLFLYNPYEIGPYSEGMIEFTIPYRELKPLLRKRYRFLADRTN